MDYLSSFQQPSTNALRLFERVYLDRSLSFSTRYKFEQQLFFSIQRGKVSLLSSRISIDRSLIQMELFVIAPLKIRPLGKRLIQSMICFLFQMSESDEHTYAEIESLRSNLVPATGPTIPRAAPVLPPPRRPTTGRRFLSPPRQQQVI